MKVKVYEQEWTKMTSEEAWKKVLELRGAGLRAFSVNFDR